MSDRDGFVQVTFGFHINCGGLSVFLLLKKCLWGYNKCSTGT